MSNTLKPEVNINDHFQGHDKAPITIVEYGDYQCPYCRSAHAVIKRIQRVFGAQIKFVFRNFPLKETHIYAFLAATAAEAAALQNKFWEMHDAIYENQNRLSENIFNELAEKIGLDLEQFELDFTSQEVNTKVEDDFESGIRSGVNGTPSFYVNGTKFDGGAQDLFNMLKESVD